MKMWTTLVVVLLLPLHVDAQYYCTQGTTIVDTKTVTSGWIASNQDGTEYLDSTNCKWLIQPPFSSSGNNPRIHLSFTRFNLEYMPPEENNYPTNWDWVEVVEGWENWAYAKDSDSGVVLGRWDGSNIPPNVSACRSMSIMFVSDTDVTGNVDGESGFNATWWLEEYPTSSCSVADQCRGVTRFDANQMSGTISMPTSVYQHNHVCEWQIVPNPPAHGQAKISITFDSSFFVDGESLCRDGEDCIIVYHGVPSWKRHFRELNVFDNSNTPESATFTACEAMTIRFSTNGWDDGFVSSKRWSLSWSVESSSLCDERCETNKQIHVGVIGGGDYSTDNDVFVEEVASWGYNVSYWNDETFVANLPIYVMNLDLLYVLESASSCTIRGQFRFLDLPIITAECKDWTAADDRYPGNDCGSGMSLVGNIRDGEDVKYIRASHAATNHSLSGGFASTYANADIQVYSSGTVRMCSFDRWDNDYDGTLINFQGGNDPWKEATVFYETGAQLDYWEPRYAINRRVAIWGPGRGLAGTLTADGWKFIEAAIRGVACDEPRTAAWSYAAGYCDVPDPSGVDDCGVCHGNNADKDECNVCFGDGESCRDCAGTLFGTLQYDECGVCGGLQTNPCYCPGDPCSFCGNGVFEGLEECDDGDNASGDGCSSSCTVEGGFTCNNNQGQTSTCYSTGEASILYQQYGPLVVDETGSSTKLGLFLSRAPSSIAQITVGPISSIVRDAQPPITIPSSNEITVSPTSVTFTASNYNIRQNITIVGLVDNYVDAPGCDIGLRFWVGDTDDVGYESAAAVIANVFNRHVWRPEVHSVEPHTIAILGEKLIVTGVQWLPDTRVFVASWETETFKMNGGWTECDPATVHAPGTSGDGMNAAGPTLEFVSPQQPESGYIRLHFISRDNVHVDWPMSSDPVLYASEKCPEDGMYGEGLGCISCPVGAICPGGYRLWPKPGYWTPRESSDFVVKCLEGSACPGGRESPCGEGYGGYACSECADGWHSVDGICEACGSPLRVIASVLAGLVIYYGALLMAILIMDNDSLSSTVSILLSVQFTRTIGSMATSQAPAFLRTLYNALALVAIDFEFIQPGCAFFPGVDELRGTFSIIVWGNLIMVGVISTVILGVVWSFERAAKYRPRWKRSAEFYHNRKIRAACMLYMMIYLIGTQRALQVLFCEDQGGVSRLVAAPEIVCGSPQHYPMMVCGFATLAVITFGIPIAVLSFLRRKKVYLTEEEFLARWGFWYETYKSTHYLAIGLNFILAAVMASGKALLFDRPIEQFILSAGASALYIVTLCWIQPFRARWKNFAVAFVTAACAVGAGINLCGVYGLNDIALVLAYVSVAIFGISVFAYLILAMRGIVRLLRGETSDYKESALMWRSTSVKEDSFHVTSMDSTADFHL